MTKLENKRTGNLLDNLNVKVKILKKKMRKHNQLHYNMLEYILKEGSLFSTVELTSFLMKSFETSPVSEYMTKIRCFVEEMEKAGFIKITNRHDLKIHTAETRPEELRVSAKITTSGLTFLSDRRIKQLNRTSIWASITIGIIVAFASVATLIINYSNNRNVIEKIDMSVEKYLKTEHIQQYYSNQSEIKRQILRDTVSPNR